MKGFQLRVFAFLDGGGLVVAVFRGPDHGHAEFDVPLNSCVYFWRQDFVHWGFQELLAADIPVWCRAFRVVLAAASLMRGRLLQTQFRRCALSWSHSSVSRRRPVFWGPDLVDSIFVHSCGSSHGMSVVESIECFVAPAFVRSMEVCLRCFTASVDSVFPG